MCCDAPARQVLAADLDNDRDTDLILVRRTPPHSVFINDRLWEYRPGPDIDGLTGTALGALVAADIDADGDNELYAATAPGSLARWSRDGG